MTDRDTVTDDRAKRPWRYYKLDAEVLQKMCEQLADKLDASVEAKSGNNSLQNVTDRDALIARLREHAERMKNRGAFPLMAADLAKAADALATPPPALDMNEAAEHFRKGWEAGRAATPKPADVVAWQRLMVSDDARELVIRIGVNTLAQATVSAEWATSFDESTQGFRRTFAIADPSKFAREVSRALQAEDENGSTLLTDVLDKAAKAALDDGAEGCEFDCVVSYGQSDPRELWLPAPDRRDR